MKRRLVLTNEAARHPFRQKMPPQPVMALQPDTMSDMKLFMLTFGAAFLAFYGFIA